MIELVNKLTFYKTTKTNRLDGSHDNCGFLLNNIIN